MSAVRVSRIHKLPLSVILLTGFFGFLAGCGSSGGGSDDREEMDTRAPSVTPGAQANAHRNVVKAVFDEAMKSASINETTFLVEDGAGTPVPGAVSYQGRTASFLPTTQLASSSSYRATITTGVMDAAENHLESDVSWDFTTASGNIRISWDTNLETAVNRAGGGYKVYYSADNEFEPGDSGVTEIDVPYVSGVFAPTSVVVPLDPGIYYLRVAAYSDLGGPGPAAGNISTASAQFELDAP